MKKYCTLFIFFYLIFPELSISQGFICGIGGGSENYGDWSDEPYGWIVEKSGNGKIVILSYADASNWLPDYFKHLGANDAYNLKIPSGTAADDSTNFMEILNADGIFLKGGDQWKYVDFWKNTLVEEAITEVFNRGGVVAGTSAGLAVLGDVDFDAKYGSAYPDNCIKNPFNNKIHMEDDFLSLVPDVLFDSHFTERGRFGRLIPMMINYYANNSKKITGIGIDDRTALCIEPDGTAMVMGSGSVFIYRAAGNSYIFGETGKPGIFTEIECIQVTDGFSVNINSGELVNVPSSAVVSNFDLSESPIKPSIILGGGDNLSFITGENGLLEYLTENLSDYSAKISLIGNSDWSNFLSSVRTYLNNNNLLNVEIIFSDEALTYTNGDKIDLLENSEAIIFSKNDPENIMALLEDTLRFSSVLKSKFGENSVLVFLGNDSKLAGRTMILGTESEPYAAYYGNLYGIEGFDILSDIIIMPMVFENSDYYENRTDGLLWGMAEYQIPFGVYLDTESWVYIKDEKIHFKGLSSSVLIDASESGYVDFSKYQKYNKTRQSVAIVNNIVHFLSSDYIFDLDSKTITVGIENDNYNSTTNSHNITIFPNPANNIVNINIYSGKEENIQISIFNILGQKIADLFSGILQAGDHDFQWQCTNKSGNIISSGIYILNVHSKNSNSSSKIILIK